MSLELGRLDPEADYHEWLLPENDHRTKTDTDRVDATIVVRDYVEQLPPTSASFTRGDLLDYAKDEGYDDVTHHWFIPEVLWLADCWKIPEHYKSGNKSERWINPQYAHREQYSPVTVECRCGGVVTRIKSSGSGYGVETEHKEECYPGWRAQAAGQLMENRRILLTRLALLAKSGRANNDLLHCEQNQVSHYVRSSGVDFEEMKRRGMQQRNETMARLIRDGYSTRETAKVYGLSPQRTREIIATDTGYNLRELKP